MIITDIKQLGNLASYKTFYAVGCSFTNYRWPTWADILAEELPNAGYFNAGTSGAGNQYIFTVVSQIINGVADLDHNDILAIMWSGFYREDRYIYGRHNNWVTPGNLYSQDTYPKVFTEQWCCPRGMTIRDMSLIDSAIRMLDSLPCRVIMTTGIGFDQQDLYSGRAPDADISDVVNCYKNIQPYLLPDLMSCQAPSGWKSGYSYEVDGEIFDDYHPSVLDYCDYLKKLGFELSTKTMAWAGEQHLKMLNVKYKDELNETPPWLIL